MPARRLTLECHDGVSLAARLFRPSGNVRAAVLLAPALGVPQGFYGALCEYLAANGHASLSFDYRGVADSRASEPPASGILLEHWGRWDIDAALATLINHFHPRPIVVLGHSAGTQLFGLAPLSRHVSGLISVSSLIPHPSNYPWPMRAAATVFFHVGLPALNAGRERFPADRLGLSSVDVPSGVVRQWLDWARDPEYLWASRWRLDTRRYAEFAFPALVCRVDDDRLSPDKAIDALLEHYPRLQVENWRVRARDAPGGKIGHVGFFRERNRDAFWGRIVEWLDERIVADR